MKALRKALAFTVLILTIVIFAAFALVLRAQSTTLPIRPGPISVNPTGLTTLESLTDAQLALLIRELAATPTITPGNLPGAGRAGTFYSLQNPEWPPLPADVRQLPVWDFGNYFFLLDDLDVNYATPLVAKGGGMQAMAGIDPPGGGGGGGGTNIQPQGFPMPTTNDLWLAVSVVSNATANLVIHFPWNETNGVWDLFGTTNLVANVPGLNVTNWVWLGRTTAWQTNISMGNLWPDIGFFRLGTMLDSDGDGLTDAYEKLVSHTNPNLYSTDGTGMSDGWEIQNFGHIGIAPNADPDGDGLTTFQEWQMRSAGYNPAQWDSNTNSVGDGYEDYSGDGLANLMKPVFGGNMMTSNPAWKADSDGDGLPDLYEIMAGSGALGLPAYSKNPIP